MTKCEFCDKKWFGFYGDRYYLCEDHKILFGYCHCGDKMKYCECEEDIEEDCSECDEDPENCE